VCANTVVSEDFKLYEKGSSLDPFPKKSIWGSPLANIIPLVHVSLLAQGAKKRLHTAVENAVAYVNKLGHLLSSVSCGRARVLPSGAARNKSRGQTATTDGETEGTSARRIVTHMSCAPVLSMLIHGLVEIFARVKATPRCGRI
jgi:hypothetical protein